MINIIHNNNKIAKFFLDKKRFFTEYEADPELSDPISLTMPANQKVYLYDNFPPYFEMFLPEGYLFEIFKQLIMKEIGRASCRERG